MFKKFKVFINGKRDKGIENEVTNTLSKNEDFMAMLNAFKYYKEQCAKYDNED